MKYLLIIGFLCLGFLQVHAQNNTSVFAKVMMGEILHYEDISIEFVDVITDSRCPINVTCVWAGEVKVALKVSKRAKLIDIKEVIFPASGVINQTDHLVYNSKHLRILCLGILPYPETPDKIPTKDYCLEIKIN